MGLLINNGEFGLIDEDGNIPETVYDYKPISGFSVSGLTIGQPAERIIDICKLGAGDKFSFDYSPNDTYMIANSRQNDRNMIRIVQVYPTCMGVEMDCHADIAVIVR